MRTLLTTQHLPVRERFAFWRDAALSLTAPVDVRRERPADFVAELGAADLGLLSVLSMSSRTRHEAVRTPALIRRRDPEAYRLVLGAQGKSGIETGAGQALLGPRHFLLLDTSLPFGGWRGEDGETVELIIVTFARKLLPLPRKVVGQLLGKRFSGRDGMGLLIWDFIERAVRDCEHYQPSDRTRLANSIVDLVAALIAHELEADEVVPSHSRHNALVLRIKDFIRARLGDPDLSPDTIAAAHYISTRQLHKLFSAEDETVAAWTRACRLEACRRDLADSMWRDEPVHVIAARRGFSSAAHFSRSFREKYGMTPKEYRQQALAGQLPHANVSDGRLVCRTAPSAGSQISLDEAG